ncbi:hypothetical protein KY285_006861 [Solanum tuberosum]|nr:hypothetical protein KY285_006861 [Solanum tuberosum]
MKQGTARKIMTSYYGIRELPLSFFDHLIELHLNGMKNLVSLPSSICKSKGLVKLYVSECSKLESLPEEIGDLENLEELDASYTLISRPPSSIVRLNKLKSLSFGQPRLEYGVFFVFPQVNEGLLSLESLDLSGCNIIDGRLLEDIGSLSSLKVLNLNYCNIIDGGLPEDIGSLSSLKGLYLKGNNFEHLPQSISKLGALEYLDLSRRKLPDYTRYLSFGCLSFLLELYLKEINFEERLTQLPVDIGCLSSLEESYLKGNNFEHLPQSISKLGALEYLNLSDCKRLTQLPEDIGCLSSLKKLNLKGNNFEHLPQSISKLGALKYLDLSDCKRLTQLPEDIGCLSSLEELYLKENNFEHLPCSIYKLGALEYLDLSDCKRLTQLPEFSQQLDTIDADWSNASICNLLFQNMSSLQHDICSSHSLSLTVFVSLEKDIPSWFDCQGMGTSVSVNLPENRISSWDLLYVILANILITSQLI